MRFGSSELELREHEGEFGAVAHALFDYGKNGDTGKIREQVFELNEAGFEFSVAGGFGKFFQPEGLFEREFANSGASDFGKVRAAAQFFSHFVRQGANVGAGRTFDDE